MDGATSFPARSGGRCVMTSSLTIQETTLRVPPDPRDERHLSPPPTLPRNRSLVTAAVAPFVNTARALVALPLSLPALVPCGLDLDRRPPRPSISFRVTTLGVTTFRGHSFRTEPGLMNIGRHLHHGPRGCRRGEGVVEHARRAVGGGQPGAAAARTRPARCASVGRRRVNWHSRRLHVG